jgi:hypothetical protein
VIDPDVEFTSLVAESEGKTYRGHEGVREWWEKVRGALGGLRYEIEDMRDLGDVVVTRVVWWGVFRSEEEAMEAASRVP